VRTFVTILLLLAGCATHRPESEIICWSANVRWGADSWLAACEKEFNGPVVLLVVHGGYVGEEWHIFPDYPMPPMKVEDAAWFLRGIAKGRTPVITSCNRNGTELFVPDVYYSRQTTAALEGFFFPGWANHPKHLKRGSFK
jgi:hypothetical protein